MRFHLQATPSPHRIRDKALDKLDPNREDFDLQITLRGS